MSELSKAKIRDYIQAYGFHCPFCKSNNIEAMPPTTPEYHIFRQTVVCQDCVKTWVDVYVLKDVEINS